MNYMYALVGFLVAGGGALCGIAFCADNKKPTKVFIIVSAIAMLTCGWWLNSKLAYYNEAGRPKMINDVGVGYYKLLAYAPGDTVNAVLFGRNGQSNIPDENRVWAIAVPKDQWKVPSDYTQSKLPIGHIGYPVEVFQVVIKDKPAVIIAPGGRW